jgi:hypothetical protein
MKFFIDITPSDHTMALGVDSVSNRNEYQEYFLWGKCGRCLRPTFLPPSFDVVKKSGTLNFLETSRPLQACNGTALPLRPTTLQPSFAVVKKSGNLNFLETSGPLQACNGTTLTFHYAIRYGIFVNWVDTRWQ